MVPETFASFLVDQTLRPLAIKFKLISMALFSAAFMTLELCILAMQLPLDSSHAVCKFSCYEDLISQVNMLKIIAQIKLKTSRNAKHLQEGHEYTFIQCFNPF